MFVPILTNVFKHWFAQEAIPGIVTKGVITPGPVWFSPVASSLCRRFGAPAP